MIKWKVFEPFSKNSEKILIDRKTVKEFCLLEWSEQFHLGTAGYRDLENKDDFFDLSVPFNPLTMAIISEAEARIYKPGDELHIGGEVRKWTPEFIDLVTRIYAAHGIVSHLRSDIDEDGPIKTTPIWLSSFGIFYEELRGGENFTASHSQSYKGGRKPMDESGMQLLESAKLIEDNVRAIIKDANEQRATVIHLAPSDSPLIKRDFDVVGAYMDYLKTIVPSSTIDSIRRAGNRGFRVAISTEGGSMGRTTRKIFRNLKFSLKPGGFLKYLHFEEDADYHGIGVIDGIDYGVDPGKWQVYKNIGAREILLSGDANVFFIWDPDGDRFNMITTAPASFQSDVIRNGLEVEDSNNGKCLIYFKPNQIYFMILAYLLEDKKANGLLEQYQWILMKTYPTSNSLKSLAEQFGVKVFQTPVGFKYFGGAVSNLEKQISSGESELILTDIRGKEHTFSKNARIILMAEESGGAVLGGVRLFQSRFGSRNLLALKEKDAFQIGLICMGIASRLWQESKSFANYYVELIERYKIKDRFYQRRDIVLFDEALTGKERELAREAGNKRKEKLVTFFKNLAFSYKEGRYNAGHLTRILQSGCVTDFIIPPVQDLFWAGDGTFIQFEGLWWELRASGTDAVLRYYAEGNRREEVDALNDAMVKFEIPEEIQRA